VKRIWLILVATWALAACQPASAPATSGTASDPVREGSWVRAEGSRQGKPIVWQMLENYSVAAPRPQLLVASWHFSSSSDDGQPDPDAKKVAQAIETKLVTSLQSHAKLVAVLDFNTQHDWYFYADDTAVKAQAEDAVKSEPPRDIVVSVEDDAAGQFYASLRQRIK
jgi:hypothetical protein